MKRTIRLSSFAALSLAALCLYAAPSQAQTPTPKAPRPADAPPVLQVRGEVVDLWCYTDHQGHGLAHRDCARACAEAGNPIGIVEPGGKVWLAMGAKKHQSASAVLLDHMAEHVLVTGHAAKLGGQDVLYVDSVIELGGYCPVAYKMAGKAIPGNPNFAATYGGKHYFFVKEEARAAFQKNPEAFLPADGGRCIVCKVKMDEDVPGDPKIFSVYQGKTYLFASAKQKEMFEAHPEEFVGRH